MVHKSVSQMWENYLKTLEKSKTKTAAYTSWHFSANEKDANELAALVRNNVKTATSSLHILYEMEGVKLPQKGELNIITDWDGVAQAITETVNVSTIPFKEVSENFARKEGEGDRTLHYWRTVHIDFFTKELANMNRALSEDMLVVCEEFRLVYK
ncbi:ASCH domain-containing protein [Bacillus sp. V59.32b]|uniref:ASCH domain-containing protein n=1 Tax=Bacillus sp. V59.32b TaxID=1758642 RepID=UPI000E3DC6FC|nr:ASCH domain-containing protein [Bacillus sp. V59.32b]RFU66210.1 ASCH domain-containing protein [Bacillus sp. V59.32b]